MGQKVNPHGLRVGVNKEWSSSWIANKKEFANYLVEDNKIRNFINKKHAGNGISKILIERTVNRLTVDIYTSKPGIVIGMKGAGVEELKNDIAKISKNKNISINGDGSNSIESCFSIWGVLCRCLYFNKKW